MRDFDNPLRHDPISQLEREWHTLRRRVTPDIYGRWCTRQPALRAFSTVDALVRFLHDDGDAAARERARKDELLAALVALARDDTLAGRVVLQALLPGLKQTAARRLFEQRERDAFWESLLAHTWTRIRTYPLEQRPRSIAANLLLDSLQRTLRELQRERRRQRRHDVTSDDPAGSQLAAVLDEPELVLRDAVRAQAIASAEARLIYLVRLERRSLAEAAAHEGVAYNVARVRLQRAERRLLVFVGVRPVPKRAPNAPSSSARASGAGTAD